MQKVKIGDMVKFSPQKEEYWEDYTMCGVDKGDLGVVAIVFEEAGDIVVDFTRKDGTICEGFYAFPEDLEVVGE